MNPVPSKVITSWMDFLGVLPSHQPEKGGLSIFDNIHILFVVFLFREPPLFLLRCFFGLPLNQAQNRGCRSKKQRARNLAPAVERFPALRSAGARRGAERSMASARVRGMPGVDFCKMGGCLGGCLGYIFPVTQIEANNKTYTFCNWA